ncbi:MAG: proline dehydrogenase family protein [Bryobacterales bacterium]|nr:proline dehydrogenase family protein [Bryobacterales bacterium]
MTRAALLFLSRQRWLRRWAEQSRLAAPAVARFVAGTALDQAVAAARQLASQGIWSTLDHLGENVTEFSQANQSLAAGLAAVERIRVDGLPATISIKLTQFGLDLDETRCLGLVSTLVAAAKEADSKVEIDMESTAYTAKTLEAVKALHRQHGNVRAVIQAYLHRSEKDIEDLNRLGISVRLCKGAYLESSGVAFADKAEVDASYRRLMQRLLMDGAYPALATHDERIVAEAVQWVGERQIAPERFEFQMLYGIRRDLQQDLARRGFRVRVYVPYGQAWYPYFMRRLAERPANVWFVLKSFARG